MDFGFFRRLFNQAGGEARAPDFDARALVNYIWLPNINLNCLAATEKGPMSHLEMSNFDRMIDNANYYPEADFQLWVDKNKLDDASHFWLTSVIYACARHGNISLRDMNDIPDYASDRYFRPGVPLLGDSIRLRADYARILVLGACNDDPANAGRPIIYSDIDCANLRLPRVLSRMAEHGAAINLLRNRWIVSHGFIGLDFRREDVQAHFGALKANTKHDVKRGIPGDKAFDEFLGELGLAPGRERDKKIGLALLPPIGAVMPTNRFYRMHGIN